LLLSAVSAVRERDPAAPGRKAALALRRFASAAAGKMSPGRTSFHTGTYWTPPRGIKPCSRSLQFEFAHYSNLDLHFPTQFV
jgi:hypothetical protein